MLNLSSILLLKEQAKKMCQKRSEIGQSVEKLTEISHFFIFSKTVIKKPVFMSSLKSFQVYLSEIRLKNRHACSCSCPNSRPFSKTKSFLVTAYRHSKFAAGIRSHGKKVTDLNPQLYASALEVPGNGPHGPLSPGFDHGKIPSPPKGEE